MSGLADIRIACVGSGIMGGVLVRRLVTSGGVSPEQLICSDPDEAKLAPLRSELGVATTTQNAEAAAGAEVVMLLPPPPAIVPVLSEIAGSLKPGALVISFAPGAGLAKMRTVAPEGVFLARVMPNTPSLVGEAMNAYVCEAGMGAEAGARLEALLDVWGKSQEISEQDLNACCALLAVGPTYLLPLAGQLMASATEAGLDTTSARAAVAQLFTGVGALLAGTDRSAEDLTNMISMQPMDAEAACKVVADAYSAALGKLGEVQAKLSA